MGVLLLFVISFTYYLFGVSPALYGGDTGEFIVSGHVLGIPHAPGYPLYVLLAKLFTGLIPWGNVSYQINLLSALVAASSLVLIYFLLRRLLTEIPASYLMLASLSIGILPIFVDQSRVAEVFGLNLLIGLSICLLLIDKQIEKSMLAVFLFGLGMGNHHTLLLFSPLLAYRLWSFKNRRNIFLYAIGFLGLGLSIYLFILIRAQMNPPVNFGDPENWLRLWRVITRQEFGSLSLHPAAVPYRDGTIFGLQLNQFLSKFIRQVGFLGSLLIAIGFILGLSRRSTRFWSFVCLGLFILSGPFFEVYSNLSPGSSIAQWRLERFMLIPVVFAVLGFWLGFSQKKSWMMFALFLFFGAQSLNATRQSYRDNFVYHDFGISTLRSAPAHSIFIIDRVIFDEPTSSFLVKRVVEKKREDLLFMYRPGTLFNTQYGEDILDLDWNDRFRRTEIVESKLLKDADRDVVVFAFEKGNVPLGKKVMDSHLYKEANRSARGTVNHLILNRANHVPVPPDFPRRLMLVHFPYLRAKSEIDLKNGKLAGKYILKAISIGPDMAWLNSNIGSLYSHQNKVDLARLFFSAAHRQDPYFYEGLYGMGYVSIKDEKYDEAIGYFEQALKILPDSREAQYMLDVSKQLILKEQ